MTEFAVTCPHCDTANTDPFEVFPQNRLDWNLCADCQRQFHFAVMECDSCGEESIFTWKSDPGAVDLHAMTCGACGASYGHEDAAQVDFSSVL